LKLESLLTFFYSSPSAKLLRAQNAPFVVYFLNIVFKVDGNLTISHALLQQRLRQFQEDLRPTHSDVLLDEASNYLTQWSTGDSRWLRRFYDSQDADSVYQLTPHTEEVIKFLSQILDQSLGFVGTESRLARIIATLNDLVVRGSADTERRLAFLYEEQKRLEQEIAAVKAGEIITHSPTAIRERFADAVTDLVSLQGDFRAVEESFKSITRDVQRKQGEPTASRGTILGFALDAEDRLKEEDQGASFQAFVRLILSQTQQDSLEKVIRQLDEMQELAELVEGKQRVRGMIRSLSAEAEKVLSTTRRLSNTLRRLLDTRTNSSRFRLAQILQDLKSLAASHSEHPPEIGIEVSTDLTLNNLSSRTFWEPPIAFDELVFDNELEDEDQRLLAFRELAAMQRLDWERMRSNITKEVSSRGRITLPELMKFYPAKSGTLELLGYIQLAHDDGHIVDESTTDSISVCIDEDQDDFKVFEIPRVTFLSRSWEQTDG
jgi:hypothetical protein